jgi:SAM-dependent methyltransferase
LLGELDAKEAVGVDFSGRMLREGILSNPENVYVRTDAHHLALAQDFKFDFIILSDLLNDVWDVQQIISEIGKHVHQRSRIVINSYSRLWEPFLKLADRLGLARPNLIQNWLTVQDIENLLYLEGFEIIRHWEEILWPFDTPILSGFFNKFLVKIWPFKYLALVNFIVARAIPRRSLELNDVKVSVVIPARNEKGNIREIFARMPQLGRGTELIFIEGHSTDNTYAEIERQIASHTEWNCILEKQEGSGKGDAVRLGFSLASGRILMILDADLTVPPEDLPRFYQALISGRGDFANGVRLVYPMENRAMQFMNLLGNKFFSSAFSWVLGQPIKDTLCGTKVIWRWEYDIIAQNRSYFGEIDPFGDFDLLLGAARQSMKIVDIPIRYRERQYGSTNIQRWKHGLLLVEMLWLAAKRLKFI